MGIMMESMGDPMPTPRYRILSPRSSAAPTRGPLCVLPVGGHDSSVMCQVPVQLALLPRQHEFLTTRPASAWKVG